MNRHNYETWFMLYLDRELDSGQKQQVEQFLAENEDLQKEFLLFQRTIQTAPDIIFDNKELLFRKEEKRRVVPMLWIRVAAALILLGGVSWFGMMIGQYRKAELGLHNRVVSNASLVASSRTSSGIPSHGSGIGRESGKTETIVTTTTQTISATTNAQKAAGRSKTLNQNVNREKNRSKDESKTVNVDLDKEKSKPMDNEYLALAKKSDISTNIQPSVTFGSADKKPLAASEIKPMAVMLTAGSKVSGNNTNTYTREIQNKTGDAVSVVSLDDHNNVISGFFKKLTKPASGDDNTRKVSVSVFKFSY